MHDLTALWLHPVADRRADLARPRAGGKHDGIGGVESGFGPDARHAAVSQLQRRGARDHCRPSGSGQLDQAVAERAAVHPGHLRQPQAAGRR